MLESRMFPPCPCHPCLNEVAACAASSQRGLRTASEMGDGRLSGDPSDSHKKRPDMRGVKCDIPGRADELARGGEVVKFLRCFPGPRTLVGLPNPSGQFFMAGAPGNSTFGGC